MEKNSKRLNWFLWGAIMVGVVLRIGAALYFGNTVIDMPGTADQLSYHNLALRILGGHGLTFGEPWWPATPPGEQTAHWSYLYTGFLTLVYALFGPQPLVARLIQAVLVGILHPWLAYRLGRLVFGELAGVVAAVLTALYAYFIYYAGSLMTEPFYITTILASLYLALRLAGWQTPVGSPNSENAPVRTPVARPELKLAVLLGLTLGAAVLLRQLFLLMIPFVFLWLLLSGRKHWLTVAVAGALVVGMILPFTVFNYARFGRFVLLNTNAGFAFYWGNHPIYGTQFQPILKSPPYQELLPPELMSLDEAALDSALLKRGIQFVVDDPGRYVLLSLSRIPPYFMFWPSSDSGLISNLSRVLSFGLMWPFMLYGLLRALFQREHRRLLPPSPVVLLLGLSLVYTAVHVLTWTLVRYRLPVDAILLTFAGMALVDIAWRLPVLRRFVRQNA